jgi:DNA-binding LytR/AlgR family response regulator
MREETGFSGHASRTATPRPAVGRSLLIALLAALFLSLAGALGTHDAPLGPRTGYWLVIMLTGAMLGSGVAFAVQSWGRLRRWRLLEGGLVALLIAVPLSLVVTGAGMVVFDAPDPSFKRFSLLFVVVLMVSALMTALGYATSATPLPDAAIPVQPRPAEAAAEPDPPASLPIVEAPPPLMGRLPPHLASARLLALEAEDHYLRVHTDAGSALILMRLSDAIAETGAVEGARCHRSWWVARAAVAAATRRGTAAALQLETGLDVPVSRTHLPGLRAAGWL